MLELTFKEQLTLTMIDKGALAVVLVGFGYFANRYLESHKAKEAVRSKLAEQRIPKIAEAIERFVSVRTKSQMLTSSLVIEALHDAGCFDAFFKSGALSPDQLAEFSTAYKEHSTQRQGEVLEVENESETSVEALDKNHFWIGNDLYDALYWEYLAIQANLSAPRRALRWAAEYAVETKWQRIPGVMAMRSRWRRFRSRRRLKRLGLVDKGMHLGADVDRMSAQVSRR